MASDKITVGDKVTTNEHVKAFYSGYGKLPKCFFAPGDVGTVSAIGVPGVYTNTLYTCIDFERYGRTWRVSLTRKQLKKL